MFTESVDGWIFLTVLATIALILSYTKNNNYDWETIFDVNVFTAVMKNTSCPSKMATYLQLCYLLALFTTVFGLPELGIWTVKYDQVNMKFQFLTDYQKNTRIIWFVWDVYVNTTLISAFSFHQWLSLTGYFLMIMCHRYIVNRRINHNQFIIIRLSFWIKSWSTLQDKVCD